MTYEEKLRRLRDARAASRKRRNSIEKKKMYDEYTKVRTLERRRIGMGRPVDLPPQKPWAFKKMETKNEQANRTLPAERLGDAAN